MVKRKCFRCGKKSAGKYAFCPFCGARFTEDKRDYGLLGRDDFSEQRDFGLDFGGFGLGGLGGLGGFGKVFNSLFKEVDKQFRELDKELGRTDKPDKKSFASGVSISISSDGAGAPKIKVRNLGDGFVSEFKEEKEKKPRMHLTEDKAKKLASLPREEAATSVRRMSNKIVYEIALPGVKSINDVVINRLENSIEIKAVGKDKAFFKLLPVNLPIINYELEKEKLFLELRPER